MFKFSSALSVIASLIVLGIFLYDKVDFQKKDAQSFSVKFMSHLSQIEKSSESLLGEKLFKILVEKHAHIFKEMNDIELNAARRVFLPDYNRALGRLETARNSEIELEYLYDSLDPNSKTSAKSKAILQEMESERLKGYITLIAVSRDTRSKSENQYSLPIYFKSMMSKLDKESVAKFKNYLSSEELKKISEIETIIGEVPKLIQQESNDSDLTTEIWFLVCNLRKDKPLNSYSFFVSGILEGQLTPRALSQDSIGDDTLLEGNTIIPPGECSMLSWSGNFNVFDRYLIRIGQSAWGI